MVKEWMNCTFTVVLNIEDSILEHIRVAVAKEVEQIIY